MLRSLTVGVEPRLLVGQPVRGDEQDVTFVFEERDQRVALVTDGRTIAGMPDLDRTALRNPKLGAGRRIAAPLPSDSRWTRSCTCRCRCSTSTPRSTFYVDVLGCTPGRFRPEQGFADVWFYGLQLTLQHQPDQVLTPEQQGARHFGAALPPDELAAVARSSASVEWVERPTTDTDGRLDGKTSAKIFDPSGNVIELKSYPATGGLARLTDRRQSVASITSVAFTSTVTDEPARAEVGTASAVTAAVMTSPPPSSTFTEAMTSPVWICCTVPASWFLVLSFTMLLGGSPNVTAPLVPARASEWPTEPRRRTFEPPRRPSHPRRPIRPAVRGRKSGGAEPVSRRSSSINGASAPTVVESPWPVCTIVSGGQREEARADRREDRRLVAVAPPGRARASAEERVAAEHVTAGAEHEAAAAGRVTWRVQHAQLGAAGVQLVALGRGRGRAIGRGTRRARTSGRPGCSRIGASTASCSATAALMWSLCP